MNAIAPYRISQTTANRRTARAVRGAEKCGGNRQFDGECTAAYVVDRRRQPSSDRRALCQYETHDDGSFWNGPRLKPAFAAQVLGQAMATPEVTQPSVQTTYGKTRLRLVPLIDA
jgi:hypothetical protein